MQVILSHSRLLTEAARWTKEHKQSRWPWEGERLCNALFLHSQGRRVPSANCLATHCFNSNFPNEWGYGWGYRVCLIALCFFICPFFFNILCSYSMWGCFINLNGGKKLFKYEHKPFPYANIYIHHLTFL